MTVLIRMPEFPVTTKEQIREAFKKIRETDGINTFILTMGREICWLARKTKRGSASSITLPEARAEGLAALTDIAHIMHRDFEKYNERFDAESFVMFYVLNRISRFRNRNRLLRVDPATMKRPDYVPMKAMDIKYAKAKTVLGKSSLEIDELLEGLSVTERQIIGWRMDGYSDPEIGKLLADVTGKEVTRARVGQIRERIGVCVRARLESCGMGDMLRKYEAQSAKGRRPTKDRKPQRTDQVGVSVEGGRGTDDLCPMHPAQCGGIGVGMVVPIDVSTGATGRLEDYPDSSQP